MGKREKLHNRCYHTQPNISHEEETSQQALNPVSETAMAHKVKIFCSAGQVILSHNVKECGVLSQARQLLHNHRVHFSVACRPGGPSHNLLPCVSKDKIIQYLTACSLHSSW